jgi:predicted amidophosphoribosyltransferase
MRFWSSPLRQAFADIVAALFPGACRGCGASLPRELPVGLPPARHPDIRASASRRFAALWNGGLARSLPGGLTLPAWFACPACAATLQPGTPAALPAQPRVACVPAFEPSPLLFALVHAFKYEAQTQLAPWFGRHLAVAARAHLGHGLVLVPVPSHPTRVRERGFDATALLAAATAAQAGVTLAPGIVERRRATAPQARLAHAARAANVAGAFARSGRAPRAARIVVLDDIVTTGATAGGVLAALALPPDRTAVLALCRARDPGVRDAGRV